MQIFLILMLERSLQPAHTQPALRTGLMAYAWRLLHIPESNS